jgi:hypothetical protein
VIVSKDLSRNEPMVHYQDFTYDPLTASVDRVAHLFVINQTVLENATQYDRSLSYGRLLKAMMEIRAELIQTAGAQQQNFRRQVRPASRRITTAT